MTSPLPDPFKEYRLVQRQYDAEMRRILEQAARRIQQRITRLGSGFGAQIRASQLRLVIAEINRILDAAWANGVLATVQEGRKEGAEAAQAALEALIAPLVGALPSDVAEVLTDGLTLTARSGIESAFKRVPRELSRRVYHQASLSKGHVEDAIRAGLVSGLTAKELAKDVYDYISPTTPGGASYAAMRLARTEINNAFHERQLEGAKAPGVSGVQWNLSGSHKVPDECNLYAERDEHGLGRGVFPVGQVPDKPHPQCFCYLTYITETPAEFTASLAAGKYDDDLNARIKANLERIQARTPIVAQPSSGGPSEALKKAQRGVRVKGMDKKLAEKAKAMLATQERFVGDRITRVRSVKSGLTGAGIPENALAFCTHKGHISLHEDLANRVSVVEDSMERGWFVEAGGDGLDQVLAHEMGHAFLLSVVGDQARTLYDSMRKALDLPDDIRKTSRLTPHDINQWMSRHQAVIAYKVSEYATTDVAEFIAEVWAEFTLSPEPSSWILKIGQTIRELIPS